MDQIQTFFQDLSFTENLIFWAVVTVLFILTELGTTALVALWFVFGALAAFVAALCEVPILTQMIIFVGVAILMFAFMRPMAIHWFHVREVPTNVNSIVGMKGVVTSTINNILCEGRAKVNGLDWSARSENGSVIAANQTIVVKEVNGVTLIVEAADSET